MTERDLPLFVLFNDAVAARAFNEVIGTFPRKDKKLEELWTASGIEGLTGSLSARTVHSHRGFESFKSLWPYASQRISC